MNSFQIKILACILMVMDHIGAIIFTEVEILRIIGRLSFPIFAFILTEGYLHTKNIKKYLIRLLIFAIIPQIPYSIAFGFGILNIFFTLFAGMIALLIDDKVENKILKYILIIFVAYLSQILNMDYGYYGVLLIYLFKKFKNDFKFLFFSILLLNISVYSNSNIQIYSIFSLFFIKMYNGEIGLNNLWVKYGFYFFYPLHILIIYGISKFIWNRGLWSPEYIETSIDKDLNKIYNL